MKRINWVSELFLIFFFIVAFFFVIKKCSEDKPIDSSKKNVPFDIDYTTGENQSTWEIIGGEQAKLDEIPWQVAFFIKNKPPNETNFCGGSIVHKGWIITSAHCFKKMYNDTLRVKKFSNVQVYSGSINLEGNGVKSDIEDIIFHPDFDATRLINDIALIKLKKPLELNSKNQSSIPIINEDKYFNLVRTNAMATASGWGIIDEKNTFPKILMKASVPIVDFITCKENYYLINRLVSKDMICAGYNDGGIDSCEGDSGGPLFIEDSLGNKFLFGVTSWGEGCAEPGYYGVYSNIMEHIDFINENCPECLNYSL
ncbi:serine protease [Costertonia aggregata]|uniref:Serine protease n=1 Tax=Costertonia aggregata TaxID=343403 RepID=A0A7H9APT4_9FLAO|nr:serine protease [Costertonia aggregata]QLG45403.1 serine protease [Costertonia aggregata]